MCDGAPESRVHIIIRLGSMLCIMLDIYVGVCTQYVGRPTQHMNKADVNDSPTVCIFTLYIYLGHMCVSVYVQGHHPGRLSDDGLRSVRVFA